MNAQQAYNTGLDDSETRTAKAFESAMNGIDSDRLPNPRLEQLRLSFLKTPKTTSLVDYNKHNEIILNILKGKKYKTSELPDDVKVAFKIFEELMQKFRDISKGGSNVGKSYKKILDNNIKMLTSEEDLLN